MAGKKEFRITTPRGAVFTVTGKNGSTTARLEWAPGFAQKKSGGIFKGAGICGFRVSALHESIDTKENRDVD